MSNSISAIELPSQVQQLLEQRQQHVDSISEIDHTLARVTAALGGTATAPAMPARSAAVPAAKPAPVAKGNKRRRGRFAVSASDLVVAFIKANRNPTTKEITQHLASQGRAAGATSNALSVLTSAGKLRRTPLGKGIMGSRYSIA